MQLKSKKVKKHLENIGVSHLYHANSVKTACTFINEGGLLSRGAVEKRGLPQSPQHSDPIDKLFNVWNDIFIDSCDLHERFPRQNKYGPVLFKLNINLLDYVDLPPIWITKDNPIYWDESGTDADRYFQSSKEFKDEYILGTYNYMITLRNTFDILPFDPYLEEIIIDNPKVRLVKEDISLYKNASKSLAESIVKNGYILDNVKIKTRKCYNCFCRSNYLNEVDGSKLRELFLCD